jgi:hypothetical protein
VTDLWRALASVSACGECGGGGVEENEDDELHSALLATRAVLWIFDPYLSPLIRRYSPLPLPSLCQLLLYPCPLVPPHTSS